MSAMIRCVIDRFALYFRTEKTLFSPNHVDHGTLAMLSLLGLQEGEKVLDLGCVFSRKRTFAPM